MGCGRSFCAYATALHVGDPPPRMLATFAPRLSATALWKRFSWNSIYDRDGNSRAFFGVSPVRLTHPRDLFGPNRRPYVRRLERWCRPAISLAERREANKAAEGKPTATVTLTVDQLLAKLKVNDYRCALTGLEFWTDDGGSYGPTCPSIDRIDPKGDYTDENTRIVLLGVNSMRGEGSDADLYRIAKALIQHHRCRAKSAPDLRKKPSLARNSPAVV
jgi:hypothetical protein